MSRPLVSIVIPTYQRAGYVETAVASVLDQDYDALELIVLDDGSTDETAALLARIAEREDPARFRWDRHENVGQAATINRGLALARGELLGYLSSDDYLYPGAIEQLAAAAEADPDAEIVYPWFDVVDDADRIVDTIACIQHTLVDALRWALCVPGVGALMRRRCYERIGGWDERYRYCPDFEWWIRARDARFACVREVLGAWRAHDGSISTGALDVDYTYELLRVLDDVYAADDLPPEVLAVRRQAYASALTLGAQVLRRTDVEPARDRFVVEDRLGPRYSLANAAIHDDAVVEIRHAYRGKLRQLELAQETIQQQRLTIDVLEATAREREARIAELAVARRAGRPPWLRLARTLTPTPLRPRVGAAVHRLRSRR